MTTAHPSPCPDCAALRLVAGPLDSVFHCTLHGAYIHRAHSADECPGCAAADPLWLWVKAQIAGGTV